MVRRLGIVAVIALVGLVAPWAAHANWPPALTIKVTTTADDPGAICGSPCSLRDAIITANAQATGTLVAVSVPAGHYTLSYGKLAISNPDGIIVQIAGAGAAVTIVDGSGNAADTSDFQVDSPAQISGLTIENGTGDNGAGIDFENGSLTLDRSVVTHNRTNDPGGDGGGLFIPQYQWFTPLYLTNDTFSYNVSGNGGGIWNYNDTAVLNNVVLDHNIACNAFAVPTLSPFDFHNACLGGGDGGGLVSYSENITLNGGSVTYNVAGSLANNQGRGGGVWGSWRTTLNRVIVSNNVAGNQGGGFYNGDAGIVNGGSITNNLAGQYGGGIGPNDDHTVLSGATISNNVAGGTFACTETLDMLSNPDGATCTRTTGTQANPTVNGCPMANSPTYQCSAHSGAGGAISASNDISAQSTSFVGNRAVAINGAGVCASIGGGVYQTDGVTLIGVLFKNNSAACGGGIYVYSAPTHATNVTFSGNLARDYGGAYFGNDGSRPSFFLLNGSRVQNNSAGIGTGGIFNQALGDLVIQGATLINNNTAPGTCKNVTYPCS
jgi:CSLREA domain-containing protein